ncbi:MAG: hypothetical protein KW804_01620 [Candidatus Doudnabacteria bacterium]|nr:hypothetical protein [Candidatus Doudnabacteria bacterium]
MPSERSICARRLYIDFHSTTDRGYSIVLRVPGPMDIDPNCELLEQVRVGKAQTLIRTRELFEIVKYRLRLHYGIQIEAEVLPSFGVIPPRVSSTVAAAAQ